METVKYRTKFVMTNKFDTPMYIVECQVPGGKWHSIDATLRYALDAHELVENIIAGEKEWVCVTVDVTTKRYG